MAERIPKNDIDLILKKMTANRRKGADGFESVAPKVKLSKSQRAEVAIREMWDELLADPDYDEEFSQFRIGMLVDLQPENSRQQQSAEIVIHHVWVCRLLGIISGILMGQTSVGRNELGEIVIDEEIIAQEMHLMKIQDKMQSAMMAAHNRYYKIKQSRLPIDPYT